MMYQGKTIRAQLLDDDIAELAFDSTLGAVNKFDDLTLGELKEVAETLASHGGISGLLVTSAKDAMPIRSSMSSKTCRFPRSPRSMAMPWAAVWSFRSRPTTA
jgi:3-hydroxyacyl-CoA dehydrogenase/enoyl-CoA hydratase/3-hydroxybutyryl-CoA epimerase/enoyl-CoA isomerase